MQRRCFMFGSLALGVTPAALAAAVPDRIAFDVVRKGQVIGSHVVEFSGSAAGVVATISLRIAVTLGPITLYRYRHDATERWAGDEFVGFSASTDDDGDLLGVEIVRRQAGLLVTDRSGRSWPAPPDAIPFTHWHPAILRSPLINPMNGELLSETVQSLGEDDVPQADGTTVRARHVRFTGTVELEDWFDAQGRWVGLRTKAKDGSVIDYRRRS